MLQRLLIICCIGLLTITGCSDKKKSQQTQKSSVVIAQARPLVTPLHFSAVLAPLNSYAVLSPNDARVTEILFTYGQQVQKGQPLISIDATKLAEDYRKAVSDFLEKKQNYEVGLISYRGTQALYKAGVISKEEYLSAFGRQNSDTLSFFQSKYELEKLLPQANIAVEQIESLNLANMAKVNDILNKRFNSSQIKAPESGIALFPTAEEKKDSSSSGQLKVGDELKAGQRILSIGDLSGLSLKLKVSEISVNLIEPHQITLVTGDAFPGMTLKGEVVSVAAQASPNEGGEASLGMFEVIVRIPQITPEQQKIIHVGMSAKIELDIEEPSEVMLPISAVFIKNNQKTVTIINKKGQREDVTVITGKTTLTEVAIVQGISPGDRVVISH